MIDIAINTAAPEGTKEIIQRAAYAAMEHENVCASVNIELVDEPEIQRINRTFRNIDRVTDVLSFPAWDGSEFDLTDGFLGDIAICYPKAVAQAQEYGHSVEREVAFLTVHGMLHIMGYDHMEAEDERIMLSLQKKILDKIGVKR